MSPLRAFSSRALTVVIAASCSVFACRGGAPDATPRDGGMDAADVGGGGPAAIVVTPPAAPARTIESGSELTFKVALGKAPTGVVTVPLVSSNPAEGIVAPATLTFTTENWKAPQTVRVTGVDDLVKDGDKAYTITVGPANSSDPTYRGMSGSDVTLVNLDDEQAGLIVSVASGATSEAGHETTFTVALQSKPRHPVSVAVKSDDPSEGTVSPAVLSFTPDNWNAPQTVTVKGADDPDADGNQSYAVTVGPVTSMDEEYKAVAPMQVALRNIDNDGPGILVATAPDLTTAETGTTAEFAVVLTSRPAANVAIGVSSGDTSEGTVALSTLTFTPENWSAPQKVTVTGADDDTADGNQTYVVALAAAISTDPSYAGIDPADVVLANIDNDSPGATVTPTSGLMTTEAGGTATFTVALHSRPLANVTIAIGSSDASEATVSPAQLTFTPDNWNAPQTVTVTGVNDDLADGDQTFMITTGAAASTDPGYAGVDVANVTGFNTDNDSAGITVTPTNGLTTTEAGGTATFTVVLNSRPTANVTIGLASSDTTEATVTPAAVTFTPENWSAPQTATVTGVNDDGADGNQVYSVDTAAATSADPGYAGRDAANVQGTNTDNDSAGITVAPTAALVTTEAGGTATFTVVLNSQPNGDVTIGMSSSDTSEGAVAPTMLTFTTANWNAPQTVTVTGVNDDVADGNQIYSIVTAAATSADVGYAGLDPANVAVSNTDNDSAGITVTPTSGLTSTEAGGTTTFTVVLNSQPTANVTIPVASSAPSEGTASPATLTFTPVNWNAPQLVTVTGVNDDVADGSQPYSIVTAAAASDDPGYAGMDAANVAVSNTDNDSAGITVTPTSGLTTTETAGTATFTVVLNSQPVANVMIAVATSDPTEGTASPSAVTFTPTNWNAPQTVTVTGVNDDAADGSQPYSILTAAAISIDAGYAGIDAANVAVSNTDNDSAGITVTPTSGLTTTEAGGTASFTVVLNSEPTASVVIAVSTSDTSEGTVSPASLTFTTTNWNAPQTVTVTGVNDAVADGSQPYTIITAAAVSADTTGYSGMDADNVSVSNTDNDTAGITVSSISGATTEAAGTATFTVVLNSEPTATVVIGVSSSDTTEGTVAPATLTFTTANWNAPRTVTVTGVDDAVADGSQPYTIVTAAAVSTDTTGYSGMDAANVAVSNTDNDSAGITVSAISGATTEAGGTTTFTVVLNSEPTANVVVGISSTDTTEGTVAPAALTFTAVNWNAPQTVTVTGVNDALADGSQPYTIVTAAAVSMDTTGYSGLDAANVAASNTDNDSAGITVSAISGATTEAGGTATFTVVLNSEPTADVVVGISSSDTTEGTVAPASLTFTTGNWNAAQTVTVTGVNDALADGSQPYTIVTAAAISADTTGYSGLDAANVAVSNTDNDMAGITVSTISGATTEAAGTATFTVVLNSEPTASVAIAISSSDTTEGTVAPASLTFTTANWSTPQTVTVTGVNDAAADGHQPYTIVTAAAVSADTTGYSGMDAADVSVTNNDNDTVGFTLSATSGLTTTEAGGTASFTIRLNSQPSADVVIGLSSNDTTEGTVSPASLTFTSGNWNVVQTVTITGVDDVTIDGNVAYAIVTAAASSGDSGYHMQAVADVSVTNTDDEIAEIRMFAGPDQTGNLISRANIDAICTAAATGWAVGKTMRGLVSLGASDEVRDMPSNYAVPTGVPIRNLTGANTIADTWADLLDGSIDMTLATAGVLPANAYWRSLTLFDGSTDIDSCNNGTSSSLFVSGWLGFADDTDGDWMSAIPADCDVPLPILCIAY